LGRGNGKAALATENCEDCKGRIAFLVGEKIISSDFGGATRPMLQTPGARLQTRILGQTRAPGSSPRNRHLALGLP